MQGLIHVYYGDGKGKTTAAMGLALRALGAGLRVTVVQFLKSRPSGEVQMLRRLGAEVLRGQASEKFVFQMDEAERALTARIHEENFRKAVANGCDVLVLDEALSAVSVDVFSGETLLAFLREKPDGMEVVLTGHALMPEVEALADYITHMVCERHPYARGVGARKGIEY